MFTDATPATGSEDIDVAGLQRAALHLLNHAGVAIVVASTSSKILWANADYCAMTGYRLEELVGRTPALLRGPDTSR
jgi:PAS domain S-box-containing protein